MSKWMLTCKEVTRLVSESLDRELPLHERMGVRMHLLMCRFCTRYKKQLLFLREAIRLRAEQSEDRDPTVTLPPEAQERLKRSLR